MGIFVLAIQKKKKNVNLETLEYIHNRTYCISLYTFKILFAHDTYFIHFHFISLIGV